MTIKHKYLVGTVCRQKISSMIIAKPIHEFPYTEEILTDIKRVAIQHTMDEETYLLSVTYLGEFEE